MPNRMTIKGMPLLNASGDIDIQSTGYQYAINTLSFIRSDVITQKFYRINFPDYLPMDVGEGQWMDEIVQNMEYHIGGTFEDGFVKDGSSRSPQVDAALAQVRMPVRTWRKKVAWNIATIAQAANVGNWDPVAAKMATLKENWDLGLQEGAFNGFKGESEMTGLLTNSAVNINTSIITEEISGMSDAEFQAFVKAILYAYYVNSNYTVDDPDTFIMPTSDYMGMSSAASATFPMKSKLEYLLDSFKKMTRNENFKILPLTYAQSALNPEAKDRYVLYKKDPKTLKLSIPADFQMPQAYTINGFDFEQIAYGQVSGVLITRPREVLYLDLTAGT